MFELEIEKVKSQLPLLLFGVINSGDSASYEKLWEAGVKQLASHSEDKRSFFRETLLLTIKLNRRFNVDTITGNRIRREILDAFLDSNQSPLNQPSINQPSGYSEPDSQISSFSQLNNVEQISDKHIVVDALLSELEQLYDQRFNVQGAMKRELVEALGQLPITSKNKLALKRWATITPFQGRFDSFAEEELRLIVDQIYTFFCDEWGPAEADKEISKVATAVESLPESRQFSLKQIL
ncbi:MAG: hypothetical protein KTR18_10695 [Acidiferrobacterales bacterium]|nr:hypothetical protein [Acidiferrobacterales bacterium]